MRPTVQWLKENYKKYNDLYFGGELPENLTLRVSTSLGRNLAWASYWPKTGLAGDTITPKAIEFNAMYNFTEYGVVSTLLHEMIHILDYKKFPEHYDKRGYKPHGAWFKSEARRIEGLSGVKIDTYGEYNVDYLERTKDVDFSAEKSPTFVGFCKLANKTTLYSWWMVRLKRRSVERFIEGLKVDYENGKNFVAYIDWYKSKERNGMDLRPVMKPHSSYDRLNDAEKEEEIKAGKLEYFTRTEIIPGFDESAKSEMSALGDKYQEECISIVKRVTDEVAEGDEYGEFNTSNFSVEYEVRENEGRSTKYIHIELSNSKIRNRDCKVNIIIGDKKPLEYYAKNLFVNAIYAFPKIFREQNMKMNVKKIIREVIDKFLEDETEGFNQDRPRMIKDEDGDYVGVVS